MAESQARRVGADSLADGYRHALTAADRFFGAFVIFMVGTAATSWWLGDAPLTDLIALVGFLVVNVALSEVSRRTERPFEMEVVRMVVGGAATAVIYVIVSGPLAPWWPGFIVMCMGGAIGFGLLTARALMGRLAVCFYLSLFVVAELLRAGEVSPYQLALEIAVVATVGLMFAEIMSLLGRTLQKEHQRTLEVKAARDALFAEIEVAQEIQTLLLPTAPHVADSEVIGRMVTATQVGGDYYDVIESEHGRTLLAIGDVSGHGVTSGLTMMMARTALIAALESRPTATLPELYRVLNRCVCESLQRMGKSMYMTFALFEYHGDGRYTAVGMHLPLLIYRDGSGAVEELELKGAWLGIFPDLNCAQIEQSSFSLGIGDLLFLYTDGVVERFRDGEMFGFERLTELIRDNGARGPSAVVDAVLAGLGEFSPDQEDDVTMLVVNFAGEAASAVAA